MLINCVAYQDGKKLSDIPVEDISEYVSHPDCFVWVALREAEPRMLQIAGLIETVVAASLLASLYFQVA